MIQFRECKTIYFVGPNGTPLLAPPPPPLPAILNRSGKPSCTIPYYNSLNNIQQPQIPNQSTQVLEQPAKKMLPKMLSKEEEMELFAIQNDCVRVKEDFVNGGYVCDDFE